MVSTRHSGSISNNDKRSPSSEQKPPSPKRLKAENGGALEKSTPPEPSQAALAENFKELSSPVTVDPPGNAAASCHRKEGSGEGEGVSAGKAEAAPASSVVTPLPVSPRVGLEALQKEELRKSSFTSWKQQNQICETATPWCKLLAQTSLVMVDSIHIFLKMVEDGLEPNQLGCVDPTMRKDGPDCN